MRMPFLGAAALAGAVLVSVAPALAQHGNMPPGGAGLSDSLALDSVLTVATLERWAVRQNADLEAARQAYQASLRVPGETGAENPVLEFALGPGSLGSERFGTAYRIGIRQPIPLGRIGPERDVARREAEGKAADLRTALNDVLRVARQSYAEYARTTAASVVLVEMRQVVEQLRRVALSRYAAGLVGEADALMAETELAGLEHAAITNERERAIAVARINALLHRSWDARTPPPAAALAPPVATPDLRALMEQAWVERPEILAANARYRANEARARVAQSSRVPRLELMAAYDRFWQESPLRSMVGVSLSLPIWSGPRSSSEGEARAGMAEALAVQISATDRVGFEVQSAYLSVQENAHEAQLIRDTQLPVAQRALGAARAGYESGRNDFSALLTAERDLTEARLMQLRALGGYHAALADLAWAVGTLPGWVQEEAKSQ